MAIEITRNTGLRIIIANKDKMEEIPNLIVKIREDKKLKKYI